jgi:hypothetical protein
MMRHALNDPLASALAGMSSSATFLEEYASNWPAFQAALHIPPSITLESRVIPDLRVALRAFPEPPALTIVNTCRALCRGLRLIVESCNSSSSSSSSSSNKAIKDEKLGWKSVGMMLNFCTCIYHVQLERRALDEQFQVAFGSAASVTGVPALCCHQLCCSPLTSYAKHTRPSITAIQVCKCHPISCR